MHDAAFGYGTEPILSALSLRLAPGSFHFLTGPSGSGKTTFLKLCYAELVAPTGGDDLSARRRQSSTATGSR